MKLFFRELDIPLVLFPILLSAGLHSTGNFVPTVFVCCCYRITHTTLRWNELCFAHLLRAQTGKGTKSPWTNSHIFLLGFCSELQTCEKGHGVKNSYCWKASALPGLQRKSFRDSGRTWFCSHVERLRSEQALRWSRLFLPVSVAAVMPEKVEIQQSGGFFFLSKLGFLTCWAQSSHFGVRSCSLSHSLGCTCLRH